MPACTTGEKLLENFIEQCITANGVPFLQTLSKQKLQTFTSQANLSHGDKTLVVKADRSFFCKLVVIARTRNLDLYDVYSYELGPIPWSIATPHGTLYKTTKAQLLEELEKDVPTTRAPDGSVFIIDGNQFIQVQEAQASWTIV